MNFCDYNNQIFSIFLITFNIIIIWTQIYNVNTDNIRQILGVCSFSASSLLDIWLIQHGFSDLIHYLEKAQGWLVGRITVIERTHLGQCIISLSWKMHN